MPIVVTDKSKCRTLDLKDNTVIVVLGASGDLAKKKTVSNIAPHPSDYTDSLQFPALFGLVSPYRRVEKKLSDR